MPVGVELRLYDGASVQTSLTGIQAMWWDVTEPKDGSKPVGKSDAVTTDASGDIFLDLSNVTGLTVGDYGFLMLYRLDGTDHEDSLVFAGKIQTSTITSGVDMYYYDSGWTRPAGWLSLGTPLISTDEKLVGLCKVANHGSNFIAFTCDGAYTVDWGDGGSPVDYATGVTAEKNFAYSDYAGSEVTHPNGESYRQALVTITPQGGSSLTSIDLNVKHSQSGLGNDTATPWLDISLSGPNLTSLTIGKSGDVVRHLSLEQCSIVNSGSITDFTYMFYACYSLQSIPLLDTSAGTDFTYMFYACYSLQSIPLLDTSAGTNFSSMFNACYSLQIGAMSGTKETVSYANCKLGPDELDAIYTNLATVTAKTITVTGNWGVSGDDPSIATAKGWTVTG